MAAPFALPMHLFPLDFTRRRIAEVDAEICALKEALSKVKLERKALKQHLFSYKYPVLTLPNEVVSEIFLQTLPEFPSLGGRASPLYLGHICQRWRDIALSTPSLWSTMKIVLLPPGFREPQRYLNLLEMWLARSRDCPLSISLTDSDYHRGTPSPALEVILAQRARWDTVTLNTPWYALPTIKADLPLLRSLEIRLVDQYGVPPTGMAGAGSARAFFGPKLTTVKLYGPKVHTVGLPWSQLTSITIHTSLTNVVQILRTASSVQEFSVSPPFDARLRDNWADLPSIPPLMHLQTFALEHSIVGREAAVSNLLPRLTLPALKQLQLPGPCIPQVAEMLARSNCPLDGLQVTLEGVAHLPFSQPDGTIALQRMTNEDKSDDSDESGDSDEGGDSDESDESDEIDDSEEGGDSDGSGDSDGYYSSFY
ncbi:hypothetical protein C8R46DRAFT_1136422 [Mycena filopes]|nr:hypothetical protein C8R46DRAFT_1136422 [Mycena filopes]